jgi:protease-4
MRRFPLLLILAAGLLLCACAPKFKLFPDGGDPLREYVLDGTDSSGKVLLLPLRGVISDEPREGMFSSRPSMVQDVVSQLRLAEKDKTVKAVVLAIDSPGGGVTASDMLYHEITAYRERTKAKILASLLDLAASGGYYAALPADRILAHPTTVTGSVGAVFYRPKVHGLLDKIGVGVEVSKSGANKDMASPFRADSAAERAQLQAIVQEMGDRFLSLVRERRKLSDVAARQVAGASVYTARQALDLGLVDGIAYLPEALDQAREMAGLPKEAEVVVYRRAEQPDDNPYNLTTGPFAAKAALVSIEAPWVLPPKAGFYYLWLSGQGLD